MSYKVTIVLEFDDKDKLSYLRENIHFGRKILKGKVVSFKENWPRCPYKETSNCEYTNKYNKKKPPCWDCPCSM